jgi:3-deoxy-D-manno-octulosonic-acid transferase
VEVIPTLKYDNAAIANRVQGQDALAAAMGLEPAHRLLVAGSTGPGEEEALLDAYGGLRTKFPDLRLAIVPRHPEVVPQAVRAIERRDLRAILRTERSDALQLETRNSILDANDVFVLNTMGELRKLFALAFAVFVGRSLLNQGGGGSDMIEVAALGKPSSFGPFTANFAQVVELLTREGGAVEVNGAAGLAKVVEFWLRDAQAARTMGIRAQELIRRQQGSTQHYVQQLLKILQ